jgi:3-phosphoshikimate 1-carboxyvinyltransferase
MQPRNIAIDGSLSSQFLTGLLMAYSASGASGVSIRVSNLKSRPYIDLTLDVMKRFGMNVPDNRNYKEFYFDTETIPGRTGNVVDYTVEGDWSGGAFLLVAGALAGNIRITGLDPLSAQADKSILEAIRKTGASLQIDGEGIDIGPAPGNADLTPFEMDATDCPDLFPPLAALAAYCKGSSRIKGVRRLIHKESNRALTLQEEFGKMGLKIDLDDDWMLLYGGNPVNSCVVHSRHDHRIAMACAVAALKAGGPVTISDADAISKSYPDFYEDLKSVGARIDSKQEALPV